MHDHIEKIETQTPDLALERQRQLRELFPEAWSETGLDFAKLRTLLGDLSDDNPERYRFGWAGKREAIQLLQTRSHATLAPDAKASVDFDMTRNWFIEGDNLEVLKLLYKPLFGRVKMIYIDPPYNTGNDFIYPDNFADPLHNYLIQTGQKDENGDLQNTAPDTAGRVHSSWLSMLYPRLTLARSLLRDDGVIFVSIDDNEVHHLRLLMNEVFGEENWISQMVWKSRQMVDNRSKTGVSNDHEYILCYRRSESGGLRGGEKDLSKFSNPDEDPRGPWRSADLTGLATKDKRPNLHYDLVDDSTGVIYQCPPKGWRYEPKTMTKKMEEGRILFPSSLEGRPRHKLFQDEMSSLFTGFSSVVGSGLFTQEGTKDILDIFGSEVLQFTKPSDLIKSLVKQTTEEDDIILDFFAGSGTTAQAVLELNREDGGNRRFVLVQLPEPTGNAQFPTIADIAAERIRRVIGRMKDADKDTLDVSTRETPEDLGFKAWKLAPSHFRQMQPVEAGNAEAYLTQLELMNDALLPGSEPRSVIYEIALREGFGLNCDIAPVADLAGVKVWRVADAERDQRLFISLDETLELEALRPLKLTQDDLFICRGVALDDYTAANLALQCRMKMI